jgi:hypothetical protein
LVTFLQCEGCEALFLFTESRIAITKGQIRTAQFPAQDKLRFTVGFISSGHCSSCPPSSPSLLPDGHSITSNEASWIMLPRQFRASEEIPIYTVSSNDGSFNASNQHLAPEISELGIAEEIYTLLIQLRSSTISKPLSAQTPLPSPIQPCGKSTRRLGSEEVLDLDSMLAQGFQLGCRSRDGYRWMSITEIALKVGSFRVYKQGQGSVIPLTINPE